MSTTTTRDSYTHDAAGRAAHPEYSDNLISIDGPIGQHWTGKRDARGMGVYAKGAPTWTVRYMTGPTKFADREFGSLDAAVEFAKVC